MMKIHSALEQFIRDLQEKNRSISTILAYKKDIEQLIDFVDQEEIKKIKKEKIDNFKQGLKKKGYTEKSISRKINAVKSFFRFAKTKGFVSSDPSSTVTHPKYKTKAPRVFSKTEYRALRDACRADTRLSAIIELLLQTGMKIGELSRLETGELDFKKKQVEIAAYQSYGSRKVPLTKAAEEKLKKYLEERPKSKDETLFLTKTGKPFLVRNIRSAINRYFKAAGIKGATVNDLRNTFIVHQLEAGVPLTTISKIAGHKRLSTTEKYLELVEEKGKERIKLEEL